MLKSVDISNADQLESLRVLLDLIADRTRQDILFLFMEKGEWNAGEISERFSLSRPTVSHHVNLLVRGGVLACRKDGKERLYRFQRDEVLALLQLAITLLGKCC